MAYEFAEIRTSQEIFSYLLEMHELRREDAPQLYKAFTESDSVQNLVKSQGESAQCSIERYGDVIYLIPAAGNRFLGYSKAQLKKELCRSNATDRDYYLVQFAILVLLLEFFDGQGSSSKTREYIRVGELQNRISERLREGARQAEDAREGTPHGDEAPEDAHLQSGLAYEQMLEVYESLRSDDRGSRQRTTKEGFLHHILRFLQAQGLIEYIEQDEMIKTTRKLDHFMDFNLLNRNHYDRVQAFLGAEDEQN